MSKKKPMKITTTTTITRTIYNKNKPKRGALSKLKHRLSGKDKKTTKYKTKTISYAQPIRIEENQNRNPRQKQKKNQYQYHNQYNNNNNNNNYNNNKNTNNSIPFPLTQSYTVPSTSTSFDSYNHNQMNPNNYRNKSKSVEQQKSPITYHQNKQNYHPNINNMGNMNNMNNTNNMNNINNMNNMNHCSYMNNSKYPHHGSPHHRSINSHSNVPLPHKYHLHQNGSNLNKSLSRENKRSSLPPNIYNRYQNIQNTQNTQNNGYGYDQQQSNNNNKPISRKLRFQENINNNNNIRKMNISQKNKRRSLPQNIYNENIQNGQKNGYEIYETYDQQQINNNNKSVSPKLRFQENINDNNNIRKMNLSRSLPQNIYNENIQNGQNNGYETYETYDQQSPKQRFQENINDNNIQNICLSENISSSDALIWNSYIKQYHVEPNRTDQLQKFVKTSKLLKNINYKEAQRIFKLFKGKGKINNFINVNNEKKEEIEEKYNQQQIINDHQEQFNKNEDKPVVIPSNHVNNDNNNDNKEDDKNQDDGDLKTWIEENNFSNDLYKKLMNFDIQLETLKFIELIDLNGLCDELSLSFLEKVRLKAAIKKLQISINEEEEENDHEITDGMYDDPGMYEEEENNDIPGMNKINDNNDINDNEEIIEMKTMGANGENDENNNNPQIQKDEFVIEGVDETYYDENETNKGPIYDENDYDEIEQVIDDIDGDIDGDINNNGTEGIVFELDEDGMDEVYIWLKSIEMSMYYDLLLKHGFDSLKMIKLLQTTQDLKDIGITMKAHQLHFIQQVKKM